MTACSPVCEGWTLSEAEKAEAQQLEKHFHDRGWIAFFVENPHGEITAVAGLDSLPGGNIDTADSPYVAPNVQRLWCNQCRQLLEYSAGAQFVQCGTCNTLNAVVVSECMGGRVMIVICGRCYTRNLANFGSALVECWLCHVLCQVNYAQAHPAPRTGTRTTTTEQVRRKRRSFFSFSRQQSSPNTSTSTDVGTPTPSSIRNKVANVWRVALRRNTTNAVFANSAAASQHLRTAGLRRRLFGWRRNQ